MDELGEAMTGIRMYSDLHEPISPEELADGLRRRSRDFRRRIVHNMLLLELILVPLPPEVTERVERFAAALGVADDPMLRVARRLAKGALGLALIDFERSGYFDGFDESTAALHAGALQHAWEQRCDDPALAARWQDLARCPEGSLGRGVHRFYEARGFTVPGLPQSAPPFLAQHDWVHVLADYGSTVESEIEIFGFIARANDDPQAFALLAMAIGLFETGYVGHAGGGFFQADRRHLSADPHRMAVRLADAMRRGALSSWHTNVRTDDGKSRDLFAIDWFEYADWSLEDARRHFHVVPKSEKALAAGAVGPWEPGGISSFQYARGRELASAARRTYDSYGATPAP
jgi:hypothetical protein